MRYRKERATRRRGRGSQRGQINHRGEVTLVSHEEDETETNRLNSSATCAQPFLFLPSVHPQIAILSCFKANLCLSLQSSKVSGCFGSESHSHTLSRSKPTSTFERLGATRQLVGRDPGLEARRWNSNGGVLFDFSRQPVGSSASRTPKADPSSVRSGTLEKAGGAHTLSASKTGYAVPSIPGESDPSAPSPSPRPSPSCEALV